MTADIIHTGRCLCGAVTFEVHGTPKWTGYCHCQSCRKHSGAPVSASAGSERDHVRSKGARRPRVGAAEGGKRGVGGDGCSTLTFEGERWPTEIHVHVGAFDK